jgi:AraC-like DNA-binding protein
LNDFIIREKIHTALFMLEKNQGLTVDELAAKLGFLRMNQFIEAFKNYIGIEPTAYQELKQNNG